MTGAIALSIENAAVSLRGQAVLAGIDLQLRRGELVAMVGPNGAGKTTLLRALAGLVIATGRLTLDGAGLARLSPAERARRIAYLPQGHVFHWPLPVIDIVGLGRLPRGAGADLSTADRQAIARAMEATGIVPYADRPVNTLSGGERARVALARVLATEAEIILADEPTASLDLRYQLIVLGILKRHAEAGGTVLAVLHDIGLAARHADRIVVLDRGHIVADGPPGEVLTEARLAETFGVEGMIGTIADERVVVPRSVI